MKIIALALLFCVVTAHCATWGGTLKRVVRSPPSNGDHPILLQTKNWSGVARGPDGARGVFSGAAAAANSPGPVTDEAFSLAAAAPPPVQEKLEERFGGPHFHGYGHHHFYRGFGGSRAGGHFHHGNWGPYRKAFAESEAFADSGCDDDNSQNDFVDGQQSNAGASSNSQANSKIVGESYKGKENYFSGGQYNSNTFKKSEGIASDQSQGESSSSQDQTLNVESKANQQELKSLTQLKGDVSDGHQTESFIHGLGKSQGSLNAERKVMIDSQGSSNIGGQQLESQNNNFGNSQSSQSKDNQHSESKNKSVVNFQNGGYQRHNSQSNGFSSSQSFQNGGGQQGQSENTGFGSSQGFLNDGSQQSQSQNKGFSSFENGGNIKENSQNNDISSSQGFVNGGGQQSQSQYRGFGNSQNFQNDDSQQSQLPNKGMGSSQGGGSQIENSQSNVVGSSQGSQNGDGQQSQSQYKGFGSSQSFQKGGVQLEQSENKGVGSSQDFQYGSIHQGSSQSNDVGRSQGQRNDGQQLRSQEGYGNAQSQSRSHGVGQSRGSNTFSHINKGYGVNGFNNGDSLSNLNRQDSSSFNDANDRGYHYGKATGSARYQAQDSSSAGQSSGYDKNLTSQENTQTGLPSEPSTSGHEDIQSTLDGALKLVSQGLEASQNTPCSTCQKSSYAFSNARSNSGSAVALSIGG